MVTRGRIAAAAQTDLSYSQLLPYLMRGSLSVWPFPNRLTIGSAICTAHASTQHADTDHGTGGICSKKPHLCYACGLKVVRIFKKIKTDMLERNGNATRIQLLYKLCVAKQNESTTFVIYE